MAKSTSRPFLGTTTDRNDAFAGIDEIDITITQDPYGYHLKADDWRRTSRFTKSTIPRHYACVNPRCQRGGIDLQKIVLFHPSGEFSFTCNGDEGTPAGRKKGDPCDNRFDIKLSVKRSG